MHDVGGQALGGVDRGCVAELDVVGDVCRGQRRVESGAPVPHREDAVLDAGDDPAVAVLDPVGAADAERPVVAAGDHDIGDACLAVVGDPHRSSGEPPRGLRPQVERPHQLPRRSEHHAVTSARALAGPRIEYLVGTGDCIADVDPVVIEVEAKSRRVAVAQIEGRLGFSWVGEADQLVEVERAVGGGDVTQYAAGTDRGQLLVVPNEPYDGTTIDGVRDDPVESEGVGHAGLIDHHQRPRLGRGGHVGRRGVGEVMVDLGERLARHVSRLSKRGGGGGRRCEADATEASLSPHVREHLHRCRLS